MAKIDGFIQANASNYTKGRNLIVKGKLVPVKVEFIVLHYTAGKGDTARNNGGYFSGVNRKASAHFFVDEKEVIQTVKVEDTAGHCGVDYSGGTAEYWGVCLNRNSIGIEMCSDFKDGCYIITPETRLRALNLTIELAKEFNVPLDRIIRHYDVCGKICPAPWVNNPNDWTTFKSDLKEGLTPDVPSDWALDSCNWAVNNGLILGDGCDNYGWHKPLTRQELAVILKRFYYLYR